MRQLLAAVASVLIGSTALAAGPLLSPVQFRDRYAGEVVKATSHTTKPVDDWTFKGTLKDGTAITLNVDNAYAAYTANPDELDRIIGRYVKQLVTASGAQASEGVDQLILLVRPSNYLSQSISGGDLSQYPAPRPMAGDVSIFLAIDSAESIRLVNRDDLGRWKLDETSAWQRADRNVRPRVGELIMTRLGDENGAVGVSADSGLAPSILAAAETCGNNDPNGMGGQVVLLYSRDMFLLALPSDKGMTDLFWKVVDEEVRANRTVSKTPLTCRAGRWVVAQHP